MSTIAKIASTKVDLIVFPELITSGYELGVRFTELAQRVPLTINLIAQRANECGVIAWESVTRKGRVGAQPGSAILVGPDGELLDVYNRPPARRSVWPSAKGLSCQLSPPKSVTSG